jgi:hypothetical protein
MYEAIQHYNVYKQRQEKLKQAKQEYCLAEKKVNALISMD